MTYEHNFVMYYSMDEDGDLLPCTAPTLTEIAERITPEHFRAYMAFESLLWDQNERELEALDASGDFQDDEDGPACWKREERKHAITKEHHATVRFNREMMMTEALGDLIG